MSNSKKTDLNKFQKKWKEYLNKWGSKYSPDESIITKHGCICKKNSYRLKEQTKEMLLLTPVLRMPTADMDLKKIGGVMFLDLNADLNIVKK